MNKLFYLVSLIPIFCVMGVNSVMFYDICPLQSTYELQFACKEDGYEVLIVGLGIGLAIQIVVLFSRLFDKKESQSFTGVMQK